MGHVINPLSFRLYNTRYWNCVWSIKTTSSYSYLANQDIILASFLKKLICSFVDSTTIGLIFVNLKIIRSSNSINAYIYIHDSFLDSLLFNIKKNQAYLKIRKKIFKKLVFKFKKFIKKKKIAFSKKHSSKLKRKIIRKYSKKVFFLILKERFLKLYWNFFKAILAKFFKRFATAKNLNFFILGLNKKAVNANILTEFFMIRLGQYYTIWEVIKSVNYLMRRLMKGGIINGYKITCSGRFSRKQRTTYSWKSFGSLALSSLKSRLDYSNRSIALKYSLCTIKIWVNLSKKKVRNFDFIV